jgi:hypothetical protein
MIGESGMALAMMHAREKVLELGARVGSDSKNRPIGATARK